MDDGNKTEEARDKSQNKSIHTSASKNNLNSKTPPRSPNNATPKNQSPKKGFEKPPIAEKKILNKYDEPERNESTDRAPKKIFDPPELNNFDPLNQQTKKLSNEPQKATLEMKNPQSRTEPTIPLDKKKQPEPEKSLKGDYIQQKPNPKNDLQQQKPYLDPEKTSKADLIQQKPIPKSDLQQQKPYSDPKVGGKDSTQNNLKSDLLQQKPYTSPMKDPKQSNTLPNQNLKPSDKMILKFDDDDEELEEKEEEKLPNFGGGFRDTKGANNNSKTQTAEINKFSFAKKPVDIPKKAVQQQEDDDEEEEEFYLPAVPDKKQESSSIGKDKEMEYLDKILNLEKGLSNKNEQISELMRKLEETQKKSEEYKQMAYKANKDGSSASRTLQMDFEKTKAALKDSDEKKLAFQDENRQLANKFKKLEMDYKNVRENLLLFCVDFMCDMKVVADYEALIKEQKQKEDNFYDLQGQKETIESTNKSVII